SGEGATFRSAGRRLAPRQIPSLSGPIPLKEVVGAQDDRGKADLHIHTSFSDGMADVPELLDYVESETDLDIIGIVDHDDVRGAALNRLLEMAELGGSDAHFLQAVGSAYTQFEGRSAADLKRAITARTTRAVYGAPVDWQSIGVRQMARQTWRGICATPRAM